MQTTATPSPALAHLLDLLTLERLDDHLFRGQSEDLGLPQVFGGQVVSQALRAATMVVDAERELHSCHCYFLRTGDANYPIIYQTEILREGRSFTSVSINAVQHDEVICRVMASFQVSEEGLDHQIPMPRVSEPEAFYSENNWLKSLAPYMPLALHRFFAADRPFDVRTEYPGNLFEQREPLPMAQFVWAKTQGPCLVDKSLQKCLLAYFSDFHCIMTMLQPHGKGAMHPSLRIATIDHSIWFHRAFDFSDWLLFALDSPNASGMRGLTRGQVFDKSGKLIASYQQEGLIREIIS